MASANTDEVFEADTNAELRAEARAHSHPRSTYSNDKGKKPVIGSVDHSVYEETPLLERDFHVTGNPDHEPPGDDEREAPEWSGARDFEGKPWWRKPSVRSVACIWMMTGS